MTDVTIRCSFCDHEATTRYLDVTFCKGHLLWFYLGLDMEWNG